MNEINIINENIKVHGRHTVTNDVLHLFWTGSSVEINAKCKEMWILVEGAYSFHEHYIAVEINGAISQRVMLSGEKQWIPLFRNFNESKITNIKVIKEVQAMSEDSGNVLNVYAIKTDGEILPVSDRKLKIEFIGDSITSGEGAMGNGEDEDWISFFFSHVNSYPYLVSKKLDADYQVFSQSGWGVYCSWDNKPQFCIPKYYEDVCSVLVHHDLDKYLVREKYDFSSFETDVVVINLGTNDDGAFHSDSYTDELGNVYKLRMENDTYVSEDAKKVEDAIYEFLKIVRKNNSKAKILWPLGMLGSGLSPVVQEAIKRFNSDCNDDVTFIALPNITKEDTGARFHPGRKSHEKCAEIIADYISGGKNEF